MAQQIVQAVHAAHEAGIRFGDPSNIHSVVICQVPDEAHLLRQEKRINARGIRTYLFREPDIGDEATALASELVGGDKRKVFARLSLWREEE